MLALDRLSALVRRRRRLLLELNRVEDELTEIAARFGARGLSVHEMNIARHLASGRRPFDLAVPLHISKKTVSAHISNINRKLGTRSALEISAWFHRRLATEAP